MTDEVTLQSQQQNVLKNQERKSNTPGNSNNRGGKKPATQNKSHPMNGRGSPAGQRPSSRGSIKKGNSGSITGDTGSDGGRKPNEAKKDSRNRPQGGRSGSNSQKRPQSSNSTSNAKPVSNGTPTASSTDSSAALSSLQRVITDLKSISPPVNPSSLTNNSTGSSPAPTNRVSSNLPLNAPVFQPGAQVYPSTNALEFPRHRKAASMGSHTSSMSGGYASYSPALGATMEDLEDFHGNVSYEDGEVPELPSHPNVPQGRPQMQSFTAPRFAALAQQEQVDALGATGRPQLAPGFMFGRRRASASPSALGPPIGEEDTGFQFPQQTQQSFVDESLEHRRTASGGEITGIMAEQVRNIMIPL